MQSHTVRAAAEGMPTSNQNSDVIDRDDFVRRILAAREKMDPTVREAFDLHVKALSSGEDLSLHIHALIGDDGRSMILEWERKFGASCARRGGLL